MTPEEEKKRIVARFCANVRGERPDVRGFHTGHDGSEGHWLEDRMGVAHNADNAPDFRWFEMKNNTASKTTFGDWSASYYVFQDPKYGINRDRFMEMFGQYNADKDRFSWSGSPIPKIDCVNKFGQRLSVSHADDVVITYSFARDARTMKHQIVPPCFQTENLILACWNADWMRKKVEAKFNKSGWFKCKQNSAGVYDSIVFGGPINYATWLDGVRSGAIYFDSGMHQGNARNYSQWRANNTFWDSMIVERF